MECIGTFTPERGCFVQVFFFSLIYIYIYILIYIYIKADYESDKSEVQRKALGSLLGFACLYLSWISLKKCLILT